MVDRMFLFIVFYLFINSVSSQTSGEFVINTSNAELKINRDKRINIYLSNRSFCILNSSVNDLGLVKLSSKLNPRKKMVVDLDLEFYMENDTIIISGSKSSFYEIDDSIKIQFNISTKNDAFVFSGSGDIISDDWIFGDITFPKITRWNFEGKSPTVYWPEGLGERYIEGNGFGNKKTISYPSAWSSLPWFTLNDGHNGVYMGTHDSLQYRTDIVVSRETQNMYASEINTLVYNSQFTLPEFNIQFYSGDWFGASEIYRTWFLKYFEVAKSPDWVQMDNGWLLAILKQQNGNVMWPYKSLDDLCDLADKFGFNTLGLFGWAHGGHDHLYPNFLPDPLMGGKDELKEAIQRAQKRGKRIVLYANGKLIDCGTDFYEHNGINAMILGADQKPVMDFYVKHNNRSPIVFARACVSSNLWKKTMYELALQAEELGADGILYDQLGVLPPELCFSKFHSHEPGYSDTKDRLKLISEIRTELQNRNKDFVVMTETTNSSVVRSIDYTHGLGKGYSPSKYAFPDLYLYTFPKVITTQRNPNPMLTKTDANYAFLYGLRHEIETRYTADVNYLKTGKIPTSEDYNLVNDPPDLEKVKSISLMESMSYVKSLITFENEFKRFTRFGEFLSDKVIIYEEGDDDILSKGYKNSDEIGVVVWNKGMDKKKVNISIDGYTLNQIADPRNYNQKMNSTLESNSVKLFIFTKMKR
ncbi:DUF6259 domain-containing protein [Membranihabitans marinus]|uniref:DUF6259 domain-containing protein n=1 Tax=Membranihabitans marinus TaxID=1227546 RepID=UPI001F24F769|nr:DUF6259 domain-containing protein [Membranihabitans marinus]